MKFLPIFLIVLLSIASINCQDTTTEAATTVTTEATGAFATAVSTSTAAAAATTGGPAPAPPSEPDNRPWYIKLRDLGILNLVFIGVGAVLLLLCLYASTCFDSRKPPLKYDQLAMPKFKGAI